MTSSGRCVHLEQTIATESHIFLLKRLQAGSSHSVSTPPSLLSHTHLSSLLTIFLIISLKHSCICYLLLPLSLFLSSLLTLFLPNHFNPSPVSFSLILLFTPLVTHNLPILSLSQLHFLSYILKMSSLSPFFCSLPPFPFSLYSRHLPSLYKDSFPSFRFTHHSHNFLTSSPIRPSLGFLF